MANPLFDNLFGKHADNHDTFLHLDNGDCLSFSDFLSRCNKFAAALKSYGLAPGDRVAMQIEKSPDALALCAACIQLGYIFLPLNPAYTAAEVAYFVKDSGALLFVLSADKKDHLSTLDFPSHVQLTTLGNNGTGQLAVAANKANPHKTIANRSESDLAAFLYTSGTTGRSKGAMLTQGNLLSNANVLAEHWQFTKNDTLLHALPIFHTHGLFVATNIALLTGSSMIFMAKFDVGRVINALPNATAMMGVPTFYTRLLAAQGFTQKTTHNMRLFISGSAPLLAETHHAFTERTGHKILERYGMTETNMITSNPYVGERKAGTVGKPLPDVSVRIADQNSGEPITPGEIGVLEVQGPNVFQGYWNMPEKTAEEFRQDGFFITGDLAKIAADGYITIVGRTKDLIISGGYNIYPKEVEEALDNHSEILESAVIGIPHSDLGEAVVGVVVTKGAKELDIENVLDAARKQLARFKVPRKLIQMNVLPRNTMGKVQKASLRKELSETQID